MDICFILYEKIGDFFPRPTKVRTRCEPMKMINSSEYSGDMNRTPQIFTSLRALLTMQHHSVMKKVPLQSEMYIQLLIFDA
jgi:hypothetical protein